MSVSLCPVASCRGKAFTGKEALRRHMQAVHQHDNNDTNETLQRQHDMPSYEIITNHNGSMMTTTSAHLGVTADFSEAYCDSTTWECTICNGFFDNSADLAEHAKACLLSEQLYQCSDCKQQFKYLSSLYDHVDAANCDHVKSVTTSLANELALTNGSIYEAVLFFDGAAIPNPGSGGAGFVLIDSYGRTLEQRSINILVAISTKHEAVYSALIKGLQSATKHNIKTLLVQGDSELIINQMNAQYQIQNVNKTLNSLNRVANSMGVGMFDILDYKWIPKRSNVEADALAKRGCRREGDQEQLTFFS